MSRRVRLAAFVLFSQLAACRSTSDAAPGAKPKSAEAELVIPKLPPDAGRADTVDTSSQKRVEASSGDGWMVQPEHGSSPRLTERALVLDAIKRASHRVLLVHDEHIEDCSSVGGSHSFFKVVEPQKGAAYYGGRGTHLPAFAKGEHYVASVERLPRPTSMKSADFCIPDRTIDMRVRAIVPVASLEEGRQLLEDLARP